MKKKSKTFKDYVSSQPPDTRKALVALRKIIKSAVPDAIELMNYDILAFALVEGGKRDKQVMIAGYKTFVGLYTGTNILKHFSKQLIGFKIGKASIQFPNEMPLPEKLITEIVLFKKKQISG